MGRKNIMLYMATALFLAVIVLCGAVTAAEEAPYLLVEIPADGKAERLRLWENEAGEYLVFLPGYGNLEEARLRTNTSGTWFLEGEPVKDGFSCASFQENAAYTLTEDGEEKKLTFIRSGEVPVLYIDVSSGSMEYIHELRGNSEPGTYRLYTAEGALDNGGNLESVQGRGNATWWTRDKKPYSLTLVGEADLLQMGRGENWILLANSTEYSHVKNKAVMDFAGDAGLAFSPESRWVDLYLNGEYAGLYLLCERNEIHSQRVDIPRENTFLISMELESRLVKRQREYITTEAKQALRVHQSYMDTQTMLDIVQSAENAMLAQDGIDPVTGKSWEELLDLDSFAGKYLLEEIFGNGDACSISQFFYYDGEKLFAGPAWDYDVTMTSFVPEMLVGNRPRANEDKPTPWFYSLYQKEAFHDRVVELYREKFRPLLARLLETGLDDYAGQIARSAQVNLLRWPGADPDAYRERAKNYMLERMAFLDSLWLEGEEYCFVFADFGPEQNGVNYAVRPGECLPALPRYSDTETVTYHGWHVRETGEPFDVTQPICEDVEIYLKQTVQTEPEAEAVLPVEEPEYTEPPSLLRLGPVLLLLAALVLAFCTDRFRNRRAGEKQLL